MNREKLIIGITAFCITGISLTQLPHALLADPCHQPKAFSIGHVDEEFGYSKQKIKEVAKKAVDSWERAAGRELFYYDSGAEFQVHFNYDDRHTFIADMRELEKEFYEKRNELKEEGDELQQEHGEKKDIFERYRKVYEDRLERFNEIVAYWNEQGGIPPEEREEIEAEQDTLNRMEMNLEEKRRSVNDIANQQNTLNQQIQQITDNYNAEVDRYQQEFGTEYKFEQGRYTGEEINIYQFDDRHDLEFVLTHEFGHALGIDHVDDPNAVMYEVRIDQPVDPVDLTNDDEWALKQACQ